MSPRRHGRGRHGTPAAAQDGRTALGEQAATHVVGAASPDAVISDGVPQRFPRARQPGQQPRAAQQARLGERPGPIPATPPSSLSSYVDGEAEVESGAEAALEPGERKPACTLAQMRRFIKSRPYVPVHELRRRFVIEGIEDEMSPMTTGEGTLFVGLPAQEATFLGELVRSGEVGCELLLDPVSPAVVGVYPMRPVARQ